MERNSFVAKESHIEAYF